MVTISLEDKWINTAKLFGDAEEVVREALRAYLIEQCQQRLDHAEAKITAYEQTYQTPYAQFQHRIQTDENFLTQVESKHPLWETDAMEWEYWQEERATWQHRLNSISQS